MPLLSAHHLGCLQQPGFSVIGAISSPQTAVVIMIKQKRIRNLSLHLQSILQGQAVVCAIPVSDRVLNRLVQVGFTSDLADGESVLATIVGPISRFNAEGRWQRCTDQPKETAYRTIEWHWTEFHGDQRVEQSDFRDIPYQRYPRTFIEPPAIEMVLARDGHGSQFVCAPAIAYTDCEPCPTSPYHQSFVGVVR